MNIDKRIGKVCSVTSARVVAVLDSDVQIDEPGEDSPYRIGQLGSYVTLPQDEDQYAVGMITEMRRSTVGGDFKDGAGADQRILEIQLVGTVRFGRFERGVSIFPTVDGPVCTTDREDLRTIFSTYRDADFSIGEISIIEGERQYVDPNKMFSKHVAVFGSTGSGKSYSVASILQKVDRYENTHVIILDLHGEYISAFSETGNLIKITELELPYWLMNFEEMQETFVDEEEPSVHNQVMIMKEAVVDSKKAKNPTLKEVLTVDTPVYFDFMDVRVRMQALDTERLLGGREGPFYGQFTRFLVRLDGKLNDKRYEFIFKPKTYRTSETLTNLLSKIFGFDTGKHITVIDLSGVPFDVVNILVSLLGRVIFDFNLWNPARRDFPVLIVFEEAHNYLSGDLTSRHRAARKTVEKIAKEGRKYGVSCMIVSQRPAEISETIIAQCNNFVTLRLMNPNDQDYVRRLVPEALSNLIDILPTLRQGEAFVLGDAVALPVRVMIDPPSPEPSGADINFFEKWKYCEQETVVKDVVERWWKQIRT
jgi:hypothetical protein